MITAFTAAATTPYKALEILKKGAKKVFVEGVPPIGCLPMILSRHLLPDHGDGDGDGCHSVINGNIKAHNSLLEEKLKELRRHFPDAIIFYVDVFAAHLSVVKEFKANGFEESFKVCCGAGGGAPYNFNYSSMCGSPEASVACSQPSKYINWDGIHLTEAMNKRVAHLISHDGHCRPSFSGAFFNKSSVM
ncbi:GDSL esterase/lipase [Platanthera zijinensis]|uniref:GDSL esterase/lipase n=1 Tax=Platanthera zijinensis TaxID=2320716 RepID=A0AAP0AU10_9ASPA